MGGGVPLQTGVRVPPSPRLTPPAPPPVLPHVPGNSVPRRWGRAGSVHGGRERPCRGESPPGPAAHAPGSRGRSFAVMPPPPGDGGEDKSVCNINTVIESDPGEKQPAPSGIPCLLRAAGSGRAAAGRKGSLSFRFKGFDLRSGGIKIKIIMNKNRPARRASHTANGRSRLPRDNPGFRPG